MKTTRRGLIGSVLFFLVHALTTFSWAGVPPPSLKIVSDQVLPSAHWRSSDGLQPVLRKIAPVDGDNFLARPADIRWDDDEHVLVASNRNGTLRLPVAAGDHSSLERAYAPLPDMGVLDSQTLLGASSQFLVTAAPAHLMSWIPRTVPDPKPISIEANFNTFIDLDVSGNRLLVLGLRKLDGGKLAADGAIAWTARLGPKLTELRPVQFSVSGPGALDTDACSAMLLGKVRFLPGGSFVVAPGAEPGIFIHDASGKLVKTLQAESLGFDAGCPITEEENYRYSADIHARFRWLNQRRVLDEILPLPVGIGFVVRTHSSGLTRWRLNVLWPDGKVTPYEIPVTSHSDYSRLAGDVRGNRIALLLSSDSFEVPPPGSLHLIVAEAPIPPVSQVNVPAAAKKPLLKKSPSKP